MQKKKLIKDKLLCKTYMINIIQQLGVEPLEQRSMQKSSDILKKIVINVFEVYASFPHREPWFNFKQTNNKQSGLFRQIMKYYTLR